MNPVERLYRIDHLLQDRKTVSFREFLQDLEVSSATLKRDIAYMRDRLHAPIEWDRTLRGYRLGEQKKHGPRYELPGLWFNASEAHALLTMQYLLENIEPGLLAQHMKPLQSRLHALLDSTDHSVSEIQRRIRILHMASRKTHQKHFEGIASAVLKRRRVNIHYFVRSRNEVTKRDVSPQRLVHYRDNWYLDAWCHLRKEVRSFALDAIAKIVLLNSKAKNVSEIELDEILASGYGIFSGKKTTLATLRFTPVRARWVSLESWHPKQRSRLEKDGSYILEFPYSNDRELIGDILKFGSDIEVLSPPALRDRVAEQLRVAASQYQ